MAVVKLTATISGDTATVLSIGGGTSAGNPQRSVAGVLQSVSVLSSADQSIALVIADATGTVFTIGSTDFTTRVNYRGNNAAIVRDGVTGQLTATPSGSGSGTLTVDAFVLEDDD